NPNRIFGFASAIKEFTKKHCKRASSSSDQVHSPVSLRSCLSFSCSNGKKQRAETSTPTSSLGSNRIKTRSLRVTLETCFSFRNDTETLVVPSHGTSSDDHICQNSLVYCCCYVVEMLSYATC